MTIPFFLLSLIFFIFYKPKKNGIIGHGVDPPQGQCISACGKKPRRQTPFSDLLWRDRDPLEDDFGVWRKFVQRLLDLLSGVDTGKAPHAGWFESGRDATHGSVHASRPGKEHQIENAGRARIAERHQRISLDVCDLKCADCYIALLRDLHLSSLGV
jgi:hypothetical protein